MTSPNMPQLVLRNEIAFKEVMSSPGGHVRVTSLFLQESQPYFPSLLDFSLSLCQQHEGTLSDPGVFSSALFVAVSLEGNEQAEKVFAAIFKRASAKDSTVCELVNLQIYIFIKGD